MTKLEEGQLLLNATSTLMTTPAFFDLQQFQQTQRMLDQNAAVSICVVTRLPCQHDNHQHNKN